MALAGFYSAGRPDVATEFSSVTVKPNSYTAMIRDHHRHTNLVRIASLLCTDMIFGGDRSDLVDRYDHVRV